MIDIPIYQVDAFASEVFKGNPAAVCPLDEFLDDDLMQAIALENNLSETAFLVERDDGDYDLRWFTPAIEVDLCGHATLASGWLVLNRLRPDAAEVSFHTRSGELSVARDGANLMMNFPALVAQPMDPPAGFADAMGFEPEAFLRAAKNMAVLGSEAEVLAVKPDLDFIKGMEGFGLIVTAPGDASDCASRYFAPQAGIAEDPVTGSAHSTIVPYWAERLGKSDIHARQVSARGGDLSCRTEGERVVMGGQAVLFLEGEIRLS